MHSKQNSPCSELVKATAIMSPKSHNCCFCLDDIFKKKADMFFEQIFSIFSVSSTDQFTGIGAFEALFHETNLEHIQNFQRF